MTNASGPPDDELSRRSAESRIADLENRARQTNNPVYVWMAIWEAHAFGLPMPDWCHGQIVHWAYRIYTLAHGLDPDQDFGPEEGEF